MILTAYDPNQAADPFKSVLDFGLGIFGHAIDNAISLGKQSNDLQNQQGAQFFSLLNEEQRQRQRQFEFAVGQANSNRTFDEGKREFDLNFGEGVRKFDTTFNEGKRLNDRAFDYTKTRDSVLDTRADRSFALQSFQVGNAVANSNEANKRANNADARAEAAAPLQNTQTALENINRSQQIADINDAQARRAEILNQAKTLFNTDDKSGVQSVKPETSLGALQDFAIAHQGEKDARVQSAVGIAQAEASRRVKKATIEQLAPEVQGLRTELADLNAKIVDPTTPTAIKDDYSKRVLAKEKMIEEIVQRFPELARNSAGTAAPGVLTGTFDTLTSLFGTARQKAAADAAAANKKK